MRWCWRAGDRRAPGPAIRQDSKDSKDSKDSGMPDRLAIKRLTASDCTLFKGVFRTIGAGHQKSINLNADVLTGRLYPSLAPVAAMTNNANRTVSPLDLAKARLNAERTGEDGEGLVNGYLAARTEAGEITGFSWVSAANAIAPYDFQTVDLTGERTLIDVKSTRGPFGNVVHISLSEIIEASGSTPYQIYRVFDLNEDGGRLRVSADIRPLAQQLKVIHQACMPDGVRVDGFSVATSAMTWGPEIYVERPEE